MLFCLGLVVSDKTTPLGPDPLHWSIKIGIAYEDVRIAGDDVQFKSKAVKKALSGVLF